MARAELSSGIEIEYESFGDASHETLLLVSGFNSQLLSWPVEFIELLVSQGLRVVRFDNRDVGLSTKLHGTKVRPNQVLHAVLDGADLPPVPYTLVDMAADAVGLLDALGVDRAHVAGKSMGGMITQLAAIEHPSRVASIVSIMSRPGDQRVGAPTPAAREALLAPPPQDREAFIEASLRAKAFASKRYFDPVAAKDLAARGYDRSFYPEGATRQLAAIYATPDWSEALTSLDVPALVVHGLDDTLITPEAGRRTAALIPGAQEVMVSDMGHDMPRELWDELARLIADHVRGACVP